METSALEAGLEKVCPWDKYGYGKSISYTTRKLTKNMSRKKGGPFFQKEVNHLDLFSWIFRGYFGYSCVKKGYVSLLRH